MYANIIMTMNEVENMIKSSLHKTKNMHLVEKVKDNYNEVEKHAIIKLNSNKLRQEKYKF